MFREDLYYRLQVFEIAILAVAGSQERRAAAQPMPSCKIRCARSVVRRPVSRADAKRGLLEYSWPGNVRELRNALERAAILCEGGLICAATPLAADRAARRHGGNDRSERGRTSDHRRK